METSNISICVTL